MRVQHENERLRKQQRESSEPVLEAMYEQLKDQHEAVASENRCSSPPTHPPSRSPSMGSRSSSMAFFDAYVNMDSPGKLRMLRRNLKWASESDLLILRQPSLFSSILSSLSPTKNFFSNDRSQRLPSTAAGFDDNSLALNTGRQYCDGSQQIVIRHIHEFKLPSTTSGTGSYDDSGCCRTSPSSCEDGPSTLDSGIGTMDSGVSGFYECVSPVNPAIVEDCTSHHLCDSILPGSSSAGPTSLTSNYSSMSSSCSSAMLHHVPCCVLQHTHCCTHHHSCSSFCCTPSRRRGESVSPTRVSLRDNMRQNNLRSSNNGQNSLTSDGKTMSTSGVSSTCSSPARRPLRCNSLPPESPTPHNSPRVPNRVTAHRNRASRCSQSSSHSSGSSMSETEPLLTSRRPYLQRSQSEAGKTRITLGEKIRNASRNCVSSSNESLRSMRRSPTPDSDRILSLELQKNTYNTKESLNSPGSNSLVKCHASASADHIATTKEDESLVCQSISGLEIPSKSRSVGVAGVFSKPVSVVRGVAAAIRHQANPGAGSVSNPNLSMNSKERFQARTSSTETDRPAKYHGPAETKLADSAQCTDIIKRSDVLLDESRCTTAQQAPSRNSLLSRATHTQSNVSKPGNDLLHNRRTSIDNSVSRAKPATPPMPTSGTFNLETHFGMHDISDDSEPITVLRPTSTTNGNYSFVSLKQHLSMSRDTCDGGSPCGSSSGTTQFTPFSRSASMRAGSKTSTPKTDVTLHKADTLFTHFVVSPKKFVSPGIETVPSPQRFQHYPLLQNAATVSPTNKALLLPYNLDSDSDEDVLEHRLVAGAYGAPLVSSESCTSVSHDDNNDTDPTTTEYSTDNGSDAYDFTPHLFKLNYDELHKDRQVLLQQDYPLPLQKQQQPKCVQFQNSSLGKMSLPRRNSLSRIQEEDCLVTAGPSSPRLHGTLVSCPYKLRKQEKFLKTSLIGVFKKKKKHKTAKMVAAETFNAMFILCTP